MRYLDGQFVFTCSLMVLSTAFSWGSLGQVMQYGIKICNKVRERHILEKIIQI